MKTLSHSVASIVALMTLLQTPIAGAMGKPPVTPDPKVVDHVELGAYLGDWYEIAAYPQWFQKGCVASTANYTMNADGSIRVINECHKGTVDGPLRSVEGVATVADPVTNAKLKVSFFGPIKGDYWIIQLGKNYEYSVVSSPKKQTLWILSRTKTLDQLTTHKILSRLEADGFDLSKLKFTQQTPDQL